MPYTKTNQQLEAARQKTDKEEEYQASKKHIVDERKADERRKTTENRRS